MATPVRGESKFLVAGSALAGVGIGLFIVFLVARLLILLLLAGIIVVFGFGLLRHATKGIGRAKNSGVPD